ncbi:hypothetical protein J6590_103013 [Homalodisca vitripennis]|nr:hypothetical protein J6590_103013 [Homalodisca vitripennis]
MCQVTVAQARTRTLGYTQCCTQTGACELQTACVKTRTLGYTQCCTQTGACELHTACVKQARVSCRPHVSSDCCSDQDQDVRLHAVLFTDKRV